MVKKLLYIGHVFHLKTRSNDFFVDILKEEYDITYISYSPYTNTYEGIEIAKKEVYEVLLTWQIMPKMEFLLNNFRFKQGVYIPMYDDAGVRKNVCWHEYKDFKIICFSKTLYNQLRPKGYMVYYIQYFPKPYENIDFGDMKSVFFWQRREDINLDLVRTLLDNIEVNKIHIHKALDPHHHFKESGVFTDKSITYSEWFDTPDEMHDIMMKSALYIAPRAYEGIGMSFLEAMAMGRCVIAPDNPTMNEYIEDGYNGFLYNLGAPRPLSINSIGSVQKNTVQYMKNGYEKWEKKKRDILKWIGKEEIEPTVSVITVVNRDEENYDGIIDSLCRCIESVHSQLYRNIQHLVVADINNPAFFNCIKKYASLGWIENCWESGNHRYEMMSQRIKGEYVTILDADSYFCDKKAIGETVCSLKNSQCDFSFAGCKIEKEDGRVWKEKLPIGGFAVQLPFNYQTMLMKKNVFLDISGIDTKFLDVAVYKYVFDAIMSGENYIKQDLDLIVVKDREHKEKQWELEKAEVFSSIALKYEEDISIEKAFSCLNEKKYPVSLYGKIFESATEKIKNEMKQAIDYTDQKESMVYFKYGKVFIQSQISDQDNSLSIELDLLKRDLDAKETRIHKFKSYFDLLNEWLRLDLQGKSLESYFIKNGYKTVAIYGIGEIGSRLYEALASGISVEVIYAIDKNRKSYLSLPVYNLDQSLPVVDVVVVSTNNIFEEVAKSLRDKVTATIVSIDDVIFEL